MSKLSELIKESRVSKKLTQDELAAKLFVTRQSVSNWERGIARPDNDMIEQLSNVLEVNLTRYMLSEVSSIKSTLRKYKWVVIAIIVVQVILIGQSIRNVINDNMEYRMKDIAGPCEENIYSPENLRLNLTNEGNTYRYSTHKEMTFDIGTYCVPLTVWVNVDDKAELDYDYVYDTRVVGYEVVQTNAVSTTFTEVEGKLYMNYEAELFINYDKGYEIHSIKDSIDVSFPEILDFR